MWNKLVLFGDQVVGWSDRLRCCVVMQAFIVVMLVHGEQWLGSAWKASIQNRLELDQRFWFDAVPHSTQWETVTGHVHCQGRVHLVMRAATGVCMYG